MFNHRENKSEHKVATFILLTLVYARMGLTTHKFHPSFRLFVSISNSYKKAFSVNYLALGYFNLVMSYSFFSETSREIVLLALPTLLYTCYSISCRLIVHSTVYYDYDNSSILLSDNICTLSSFEFYLFFKYITILKKQPSKSILLADYLSDSSVPHDIVVMHTVNNWYWTVLGTVQMKPEITE